MYLNKARNVCQALPNTIDFIGQHGVKEESRAGDVIVAPYPIITITEKPRERVLFSAIRDANPFFHLAEAIWMLAGRADAAFLTPYIRDFGNMFAESNGDIHDAYGRRWRSSFGFDQLDAVISKLFNNPYDRQAVIAMWDPRPTYNNDLLGRWKSRPCNTNIFLRVNNNALDLTVVCRSNDMLWGAHGANAVHFSVLQEYLAARIDAEIGVMYQLSNNAHVYMDEMISVTNRIPNETPLAFALKDDRYSQGCSTTPMFVDPEGIDDDIDIFMENYQYGELHQKSYSNIWFYDVLSIAIMAHRQFKDKKFDVAIGLAKEVAAEDWSAAMTEWIERRAK
jgi:thymidylate synthase